MALFAQSGKLDNSFGTGGTSNTIVGSGGQIWAMSSIDGWSVVVGGLGKIGNDTDFTLMKFTQDGTADATFGSNGIVTTQVGGHGSAIVYATMLQNDGKVIAAGKAWNGTSYDFAIVRYTIAGIVDSTFGTNGKIITHLGTGNNVVNGLCTQDGWSVVVGGIVQSSNNTDFVVMRYTRDGIIDSTFGANGIVTTDFGTGNNDVLSALAVQSDSSIIAVGTSSSGSVNSFALARYTKTGALDNTFGTGGMVIVSGSGDDEATSISLRSDGKMIVGGYISNGVNDDFGLMRFKTTGEIDNSFGNNGKVITPVGNGDDGIYALVTQTDGKIIGTGSSLINGIYRTAMVRYNATGSLDTTFGVGGKVIGTDTSGNSEIYAATLQNDGKVLVAGYSNNGTTDQLSLSRYSTTISVGLIDFATSDNQFIVYPNPVAQNATLEYALNKDENVTIKLIDMEGRMIETIADNQLQVAGKHKQAVVMPDVLAPGSYLLVISSASGKMSIKIVK